MVWFTAAFSIPDKFGKKDVIKKSQRQEDSQLHPSLAHLVGAGALVLHKFATVAIANSRRQESRETSGARLLTKTKTKTKDKRSRGRARAM